MPEPLSTAAIDIPEIDLVEQRTPWQEPADDSVTNDPAYLGVIESTADEGDLLEQARAVAPVPDDDDHPYGASN